MSLSDAADRRRAREERAAAVNSDQTVQARQREQSYDAAVARFGVLIGRLHRVAGRYAKNYRSTYGSAHKGALARMPVSGQEASTRHEIAAGVTVILTGTGRSVSDIVLELQVAGVVGGMPGLLLMGLMRDHWRIRVGTPSTSDYAPSGSFQYNTVLSSTADALHVPPRADEYVTSSDQRANCLHYWSQVDEGDVWSALEELITLFLDHYGIAYAEVENA